MFQGSSSIFKLRAAESTRNGCHVDMASWHRPWESSRDRSPFALGAGLKSKDLEAIRV